MFIRVCIYLLWLLILATAGPILFQLASTGILMLMGHSRYDAYWTGYEHILYSHYFSDYALMPALVGGIMLLLVACQQPGRRIWERRVSLILGAFALLPGLLASHVLYSRVRMIIY